MEKITPFESGRCRVTLSLPQSDVSALVRLTELTGKRLNAELLRVMALYMDAWSGVGDELDHLFAIARDGEPKEALALTLPGWALTALTETAHRYDATPDEALAVMVRGTVRTLLRAEGLALVKRKPFVEAFLDMVARDAS